MDHRREVDLSQHGTRLAPRVLGREIREKLTSDAKSGVQLIFDLRDITTMSTGFAKELFGELAKDLSEGFADQVRFKFGDNKEVLRRTIARGLKASASRTSSS
jgi:hypothetical protein